MEDIESRASRYADQNGIVFQQRLGHGKDGIIFQTSRQTAVKVFLRRDMYSRELACYRRFLEREVEEVCGHFVPRLIAFDDDLLAVEMEIVSRPFLLDFADAYLDFPPDFSEEVIAEWHAEKAEHFGARWPEVLFVMETLRDRYGIHLMDVNPGNIAFVQTPG